VLVSGREQRSTATPGSLLLVALVLLASCRGGGSSGLITPVSNASPPPVSGGPTATPSGAPNVTAAGVVTFPTPDGVTLSGRVFGPRNAEAGIVLAHGATVNQSSWFEFAEELGQRGYLVLTFNFRGYCPGGDSGCSHGSKDTNARPTDLHAAIDVIRSFAIRRLGLMGSSLGGWAALTVAADEGDGLDLVVALSAVSATDDDLRKITAAKLFMAGTGDDGIAGLAQQFYDASSSPKKLVLLDTDDHGAEMLRGSQRDAARAAVFDWLDQYLPV
jgi:alpha-beta hydrolase superfamily lysophospholipase